MFWSLFIVFFHVQLLWYSGHATSDTISPYDQDPSRLWRPPDTLRQDDWRPCSYVYQLRLSRLPTSHSLASSVRQRVFKYRHICFLSALKTQWWPLGWVATHRSICADTVQLPWRLDLIQKWTKSVLHLITALIYFVLHMRTSTGLIHPAGRLPG